MTILRVVVVDDIPTYVDEISECLMMEPDITVAGVARDGKAAVNLVLETMPDVVLMDIGLPVMNGIEAIRRIRREAPSVKPIVLTVDGSGKFLFEAFKAGAKDYLLKTAPPNQIADAVREAAHGKSAIPPALAQMMCEEFDRISQQPTAVLDLFDVLTLSEVRVLKCIGEEKSNAQIMDALCITDGAARNYVSNILRKLEVNNRIEAGLIARKIGLATDV